MDADIEEVKRVFPQSYATLIGVSCFEAAWGLYMLCCTKSALTNAIGRVLRVGAESHAAIVPSLAYAGGLRLAIAMMILVAVVTPHGASTTPEDLASLTHRLTVAAVVHTCILQPFMAAFRTAPRIPTACWMLICLMEGTVLTASLAAECHFNMNQLANFKEAWYFHAAYFSLAVGIVLTLWASSVNCCCVRADAQVASSGVQLDANSLSIPLFDENRHQLSPASRRLLS